MSVLSQDPGAEEMQIEVVDDASTSGDAEALVRRVGGERVDFVRQPRRLGGIANWNSCVERSRGQWVHILHSDDVVFPGFYAGLEAALKTRDEVGAAFCRYVTIDENEVCLRTSELERLTPGILPGFIARIGAGNRIQCPSIAVRRRVYERLGGFRPELSYAADWEMWIRIAAHYPIWYEPETLAAWRIHSGSWTTLTARSGQNIADARRCVEVSRSLLPPEDAGTISRKARENVARLAISGAYRALLAGEVRTATRQAWEGLKCGLTLRLMARTVLLLPVRIAGEALRRMLAGEKDSLRTALRSTQGDENHRRRHPCAGAGPGLDSRLRGNDQRKNVLKARMDVSSTTPPLVSVIITTRNRRAMLEKALRSVYSQDCPNREILVLDDASEDGTSDFIRSHHPDVRLFRHEENRGLIAGRNLLMREARGDYLISIDDDAYFLNTDAMSNVVARMEAEPELGIINFRVLDPEDHVPVFPEAEYYTSSYWGLGHCVRKAVLQETGYYRELVKWGCEERDLSLRVLDKGYRLLQFPGATVVHPCFVAGKSLPGSPEYRDLVKVWRLTAKARLLQAWLNEPFPWWVLSTANVLAGYSVRAAWRRSLRDALRGFCEAFKEFPTLKKTRRPVSPRAMRLYLALARHRLSDASQIRAIYKSPPGILAILFGLGS